MADEFTKSTVIPGMLYEDARGAIDWLCDLLGFTRHLVVPGAGDTIAHAQLVLGNGMIMLGSTRDDETGAIYTTPKRAGTNTQSAYILVEEIDAHYERAKSAGAEVVMDIRDQHYGGRAYSVRDPEGHVWHIGSHDPWTSS